MNILKHFREYRAFYLIILTFTIIVKISTWGFKEYRYSRSLKSNRNPFAYFDSNLPSKKIGKQYDQNKGTNLLYCVDNSYRIHPVNATLIEAGYATTNWNDAAILVKISEPHKTEGSKGTRSHTSGAFTTTWKSSGVIYYADIHAISIRNRTNIYKGSVTLGHFAGNYIIQPGQVEILKNPSSSDFFSNTHIEQYIAGLTNFLFRHVFPEKKQVSPKDLADKHDERVRLFNQFRRLRIVVIKPDKNTSLEYEYHYGEFLIKDENTIRFVQDVIIRSKIKGVILIEKYPFEIDIRSIKKLEDTKEFPGIYSLSLTFIPGKSGLRNLKSGKLFEGDIFKIFFADNPSHLSTVEILRSAFLGHYIEF